MFSVQKWYGLDPALSIEQQKTVPVAGAIRMAPGALKDLSLEDWNITVSVGLTGTFLMCQAAARWMIDHERPGTMVNISSIGGVAPYGMSGAYSTVKGAVIMLSKHTGIEWASRGIRVNAVMPGLLVDGGLAASVMNHLPGRKWD